jgi:hypothetical protein
MRSGVTAALGSVFLILIICAFSIQTPQGLMTKIAIKRSDCGDMSALSSSQEYGCMTPLEPTRQLATLEPLRSIY